MSVISKNPFDLLGEDGDESPAPAPKPAAKKADAPAPARAVPGAAKAVGGDRGGRGGGRGPRGATRTNNRDGDRNSGLPSSDGVAEGMETPGGFDGERVAPSRKGNHVRDAHTKGPPGDRPAKNYTSGGHSSSRGGRGGSRVPAGGGERRQFERRSGGLPDSQKKVDQGWGANEGEAELTAEVEGEADAIKEENTPQTPAEDGDGGWAAPDAVPAAAAAETTEAAEPAEPEEVQKSLDEYLAERAAAAIDFGKKESRQVSADTLEGQEFRRAAIDDFYAPKEKKETKTKAAPKKEKVYIAFDGQFATPPGGGDRPNRGDRGERGGRGGAGGERGGRGRGGPRGGARGARGGGAGRVGAVRGGANLDSNDQTAFPALGA